MAADRCLSADPIQTETVVAPRAAFSESHLRRSASEDLQNLRLKRQKRISTDETPKSQSKSQTFYFVDSNSSSREKRAHVMRHHVQEKRRQQRHSHSRSGSEVRANGVYPYLPWEQRAELPESADGRSLDDSPRRVHAPLLNPPDSRENTLSRLKPVALASPPLPSLTTMLSASRKDPFEVLPITPLDMELADYWANKLTYWSGQNTHIKDCVFKTAMAHPLSFRAVILSYCARWKAQLYNHPNTREIEFHLGNARKGVEDAINGHVKIDGESLAMAFAGLALQEDRFGSKEKAAEYEDRAVQILRTGRRSSGLAEVFLHYVRYVMVPSPLALGQSEHGQGWLVTFLRAAERLMLSHNNDKYLTTTPQRRAAFQMESPLFSLLSSGPRPSRVPHDSRIYVVRNVPTQEITRTAALIYITAALWDFQDSHGKTQRFLIYLNNLVRKHELDRFPACESFIWHLLEENCDIDLKDSERGWSTGELLKIHKRLPPDLRFQYNETLFSFLMLVQPIRGVETFEKELATATGVNEADF
ncbi:uncharacterized protein DSM5745_08385 [Aspergillus mulundensis]|uniref:Uncharacterized protein n=1 Tax=Aspergillus mulundensis TaxID=1810919 RepID=A0A3D8RAH8_9EURO|nr:Uncharacterized protein DSM5745_08385 [Aspergillus mulundensis]RDW70874.1 Uncharacterized protein DSM5745_08385 [Aspergillus mulundensis]